MFNWICPQCGSEVLASYAECPECAKRTAQPAAPAQTGAPEPPAPAPVPPPAAPPEPVRSPIFTPPPARAQAPVQPVVPPGYYMQPQSSRGLPTWLLSIVFALAFVGLGAGVYWSIQHFKGESAPVAASGTALENPASKAAPKPSPYQKFVEVAGVRLYQNAKKQVEARFLLVNHSEGEMSDVAGTVEIRGRTAKEGEEPVGSFTFKGASIGPNESKEMTAKVDTRLKVYELPDWQNVDARLKVTAP